ncbi:MAG TPA: UbiA-like polyprenyltransferase [Candidatus Thermoplasmatota archaeon]|nr:UbiA-like polyprenyltransferase [Candidatus Thermoplasmatota archaeon]
MAVLPAASARTRTSLGTILEFVKIEHSLFALPFVLAGMVVGLVAVGRPLEASWENARLLALVLAAAVSARTLAMTLNRILDRAIDAANPRTASRALASGAMGLSTAWTLAAASLAVLAVSAALLNPLCLALAPLLVGLFFAYPYAKRHTWACHFVLGLAFFSAPGGGFLAVTGSFDATWLGVFFGFAAFFWVAGFDVVYALLDVEHDRAHGIRSIPARFGVAGARAWARALHALTVLALAGAGLVLALAWPYWVAVALVAGLLAYEHLIADPKDPVALNKAFFNVNAGIGWIVLAGLLLGL